MDMSYIMDSGQNWSYTSFPNIFSLISADPADLSKNENCHILEKITIFESNMCSRGAKSGPMRIAR